MLTVMVEKWSLATLYRWQAGAASIPSPVTADAGDIQTLIVCGGIKTVPLPPEEVVNI